METEALVVSEPIDSMIVALTPAEMPAAQSALVEWCDRTLAQLGEEVKDLEEHRHIAKANGWKLSAVERQLSLAKRRITYYGKVKAAVEAGYLLVPNMPVDVFAIRVTRERPPQDVRESSWRPRVSGDPQQLPAGEGRYVNPDLPLVHETTQEKKPDGQMVTKHFWNTTEYTDVDFPVKAVKPVVLDATARAMGLKIFDQLGIVRDSGVRRGWGRKGDPIIVGQLIDPRGNGRGTTFFIAWWLNTADL